MLRCAMTCLRLFHLQIRRHPHSCFLCFTLLVVVAVVPVAVPAVAQVCGGGDAREKANQILLCDGDVHAPSAAAQRKQARSRIKSAQSRSRKVKVGRRCRGSAERVPRAGVRSRHGCWNCRTETC